MPRPYRIPGRPYSVDISFPFETGVFFSIALVDEQDKTVQRWEKPIPADMRWQINVFRNAIEDIIVKVFGR